MTVKALTDQEANSLALGGGVTDVATAVRHTPADADPWLAHRVRTDARMVALLAVAANLRVEQIQEADDAVAVLAGRCSIGGVSLTHEGADPAVSGLPDNATTLIWAEPDGDSLAIASGAQWPPTAHLKLAEVSVVGGAIAFIADRRLDHIFSA